MVDQKLVRFLLLFRSSLYGSSLNFWSNARKRMKIIYLKMYWLKTKDGWIPDTISSKEIFKRRILYIMVEHILEGFHLLFRSHGS